MLEEFLFLERGKEFWMPVQKGTAQAIARDLKAGDEIVIYYFYLGGFNAKSLHAKHSSPNRVENFEPDGIRWLFAVERFEKLGSSFPLMLIGDVIERNKPGDIKDIWVDSRQVKAKLKATFTGKFREVTGKRRDIRDSWLEKQGAGGASRLMQNEGLFKVEDKEFWIVLRNQTREHLTSYAKQGDVVFLNTILAGAVKTSKGVEWVFISGEYSTF
ncbi:MAG TPA: hypothetical protein VNA17_10955 [Pyrinomonadaceae bacterium]|nr:hypothetical protein [Pyrinomonadaceae bacterium]